MRSRSGFTLIELLSALAIVVILSIIVLITLNPAELLKQSRDSNRVSDLDTLDRSISAYLSDASAQSGIAQSLGATNTVYISIPDKTATSSAGDQCQGLGLPSLATSTGYTYHCAATSTYRKNDGTGWIPINFSGVSTGAPLEKLPIDGINTTSSGYFYTYQTDGSSYEVTAVVESQKYQTQNAAQPAIPAYPNVIVNGSTKTIAGMYGVAPLTGLATLSSIPGLIAYYPLDEGTGTVATDMSGNGNNGTWSGTMSGSSTTYYTPGKVGSYAGYFDGTDNHFTATVNGVATATGAANTINFWMKYPTVGNVVVSLGTFNFYMSSASCVGLNNNGAVEGAAPPTANQWVDITFVIYNGQFNSNGSAMYYNGSLVTPTCDSGTSVVNASTAFIAGNYWGGSWWFPGSLDDIRIYNRALTPTEIQTIYNVEK